MFQWNNTEMAQAITVCGSLPLTHWLFWWQWYCSFTCDYNLLLTCWKKPRKSPVPRSTRGQESEVGSWKDGGIHTWQGSAGAQLLQAAVSSQPTCWNEINYSFTQLFLFQISTGFWRCFLTLYFLVQAVFWTAKLHAIEEREVKSSYSESPKSCAVFVLGQIFFTISFYFTHIYPSN